MGLTSLTSWATRHPKVRALCRRVSDNRVLRGRRHVPALTALPVLLTLHDLTPCRSSSLAVMPIVGSWYASPYRASVVVMGPVEESPEYKLVVKSNNITVEVDNELSTCRAVFGT